MRFFRRIAGVLLVACLLCCCGCLPHTELDKQAIVCGIGIDRSEDGFEATVQYFSMEGAGGTTLIDNTKANVLVVSGKGSSVYTALESASVKCGKNFMYGITSILVLGEGAADPDLDTVLSFAQTYYENNPRLLIAVADGKASDVMNVKFKEENVSPDHLDALLQNAENKGLCETKRIYEVLDELRQPTGCTVLPLLSVKETGTGATDDGKTVQLAGGVLFSDGKQGDKISLSALSGIQLLNGETENTCVLTEIDGKSVAVTLYNIHLKTEPSYKDGKLRFTVQVEAGGKYADSPLENKGIPASEKVEKQCAAFLTERIESAVSSVVNGAGCDPCRLKYAVSSRSYSDWLRISENFGELLKTAEFLVKCDIDIDRFGLAH